MKLASDWPNSGHHGAIPYALMGNWERMMPRKYVPDGGKIKSLRQALDGDYTSAAFAHKVGMSRRTLQRVENDGIPQSELKLHRIAKALKVPVDAIIQSTPIQRPDRIEGRHTHWSLPKVIPRFSKISIAPAKGASAMVESVEIAKRIVPHIFVNADADRFAYIEELLEILNGINTNQPAFIRLEVQGHPRANVATLKRISELLVWLKGNDIIVCADLNFRHPSSDDPPELVNWGIYGEFHIAFVSPDPHGDHSARITIDYGKDIATSSENAGL